MSSPVEHAALVALLREGRRSWQVYAELVEETGSALQVLEQELEREDVPETFFDLPSSGVRPRARVDVGGALDEAAAELAKWRSEGIEIVTVLDASYPENLRGVHGRPPLLFVAGELAAADVQALSVVGNRVATESGIAAARRIASDLANAGYAVFSGLAAGTGLRHCYPPQNIELARRIAHKCALVSQFWPDSPPTRRTFPMRNAVMSGMTLGTVIVEASHSSGTRIQARLALAQGRPVFLHRALLSQLWARELASHPGAYPIASAREVVAIIERMTGNEELETGELGAPAPRG
jgi:DNA processing protein